MRVTSTIVALAFALVSLGLTPECFCHAPRAAAAAPADDAHACCHGADPRAEPPPEAQRLRAACDKGCCDPAEQLAEAPPAETRAALDAPTWVQLPATPWPPAALAGPRAAAPLARFIRGPPSGPPAPALAHLQVWRC